MIFLIYSISNILESIGMSLTGSVSLLALFILAFFSLLMFISNIPASYVLVVLGVLVIGMNAVWGGTVLHILAILVALILGTTVGLFMIRFFNNNGT